jgi:PAS domain S-box-containing protein
MSEGFALHELICDESGKPADYRFLEVNEAFERQTGLKREAVIGRTLWEVFPNEERYWVETCGKVALSGEPVRFEDYSSTLGKWYEVYAFRPAEGQFAVLFLDITKRKQMEQRTQEIQAQQREFFRRTIQAATRGKLIITDRCEILQYAGEPLKRWNFSDMEELTRARREAMEIARLEGLTTPRLNALISCVAEMLTNALKHAGSGVASLHRRVEKLVFLVLDGGTGIEFLNIPDVALTMGFSTAGTGGFGYKLIIASADKVLLDTGSDGTAVAVELSRS